jgi:hypothetical protein
MSYRYSLSGNQKMAHGSSTLLHRGATLLPAIRKVVEGEIPRSHPVSKIEVLYAELKRKCPNQFVPDYAEFMISIGCELGDYCMGLCPVEGDPFIEFIVLRAGSRVPGMSGMVPGQPYTKDLLPDFAAERMMELASCLSLKSARLSNSISVRKGAVNIKIYRGVFPVWNIQLECHCVVLAIAPVYVSC